MEVYNELYVNKKEGQEYEDRKKEKIKLRNIKNVNYENIKINNEKNNKITMTYITNKEKNIKILGEKFVENNRKNYKLLINGIEYEIGEYIEYDKFGFNENDDF